MLACTRRGGALRGVVWTLAVLAVGAGLFALLRLSPPVTPARIALVTADDDPYWNRLIAGAEAAARDQGVRLTVMKADGSLAKQSEVIVGLAGERFDGVAISPIDAAKQALSLRRLRDVCGLVTVDSDCPSSGRVCFVGADNYAAGRVCARMLKQALPEGGRVVIVMGPIDKENGQRRRQGVIDELLDRPYDPDRPADAVEGVLKAEGALFTVAATLIDEIDPAAAEANVAAALKDDAGINGVVGLYAYSTPAAVRAVRGASATDRVEIVGFDDRDETLDAIADGSVFATVAQDQYTYGYSAIRVLADIAAGREPGIPYTSMFHVPPTVVTADSLDRFRAARTQ